MSRKGFTVVEIIISITIILIIGTAATAFVIDSKNDNKLKVISKQVLESAQVYLENEFDENGKTYKNGLLNGGNAVVIPLNELEEKGYLKDDLIKTLEDNDISKEEYILAGVFEDAKELCSSSDNVIEFETSWSDKLKGLDDPIYICGQKSNSGATLTGTNNLFEYYINSPFLGAADYWYLEFGYAFEEPESYENMYFDKSEGYQLNYESDDYDFWIEGSVSGGGCETDPETGEVYGGPGDAELYEIGVSSVTFRPRTMVLYDSYYEDDNSWYVMRGDFNYNYIKINNKNFRIVKFVKKNEEIILTLIAVETFKNVNSAEEYINSIFKGDLASANITSGELNYRNLNYNEAIQIGALELYSLFRDTNNETYFCDNYLSNFNYNYLGFNNDEIISGCLKDVRTIKFNNWLNGKPIFINSDNRYLLTSKGLLIDTQGYVEIYKNWSGSKKQVDYKTIVPNLKIDEEFLIRPVVDIKLSSIKSYEGIGTEDSPFILNF